MCAGSVRPISIVMATHWRADYSGRQTDFSRYHWMRAVDRTWRELTSACSPRFDHCQGWMVSVVAQLLAFAARRPGKTDHSAVKVS